MIRKSKIKNRVPCNLVDLIDGVCVVPGLIHESEAMQNLSRNTADRVDVPAVLGGGVLA